MGGVLLAEATVLGERKLFFHLFLIALGIVRNPAASTTLQFGHVVFDLAHTSALIIRINLLPNKVSETKVYFRFRASAGKIGSISRGLSISSDGPRTETNTSSFLNPELALE